MTALETPVLAALNHLLDTEQWARDKLAPFAGERVEVRPAWLPPLRLLIVEGGRLHAAPTGGEPSLVIRVGPEMLAALAQGEEHALRAVEISGNARLASEVLWLLRHLRWDVEEDLSAVVGDVAAHRLVATARRFAGWQVDVVRRGAEGLMEYVVEEKRLLVRRAELEAFAVETARLRDAVERLDQRIRRLAGS